MRGSPLQIEVLGPLRVSRDGADLTPSGVLQRRLLAFLTLRRGSIVSADVLVEVLWPISQPDDPTAAVQNHVSRLRRALPGVRVESLGSGYRLDPAGLGVDADRATAAVREGTIAPSDVAALLEKWTGPAYPELDETDEGRAEASRLEEVRSLLRESWAATQLAGGEIEGLVAELGVLVDEQPLRERPRSLLMSALVASGRRADALRVYDDFRRRLGDELGIEPSPALTAEHARILAGSGDAPWAPASRLPTSATSLIGRATLVDDVAALVEHERVATLLGPGGVGKTRLTVEVGHRLRASKPGRPVVLCELGAADPGSVGDVVAASLGIDARPGTEMDERIIEVIGAAEIVVLLDNCEHVLEPVASLVEALVRRCGGVKVLASSRERLRVDGEHLITVPPLRSGPADSPAVTLFCERARAIDQSFDPSDDELELVCRITDRLDGLPLAIELAASRLHTHSVQEVAAGLDERFALLSSGSRTSPRHGSLGATVAWSYDMLDAGLQEVFADLSVFATSFGVRSAAAVSGTSAGAAGTALDHLVERSLVTRGPRQKYVLLETLRAFGAQELVRQERADVVAARHAHHFVDWAERSRHRLLEPETSTLVDLDDSVPDLANALGWLLDHDEVAAAGRLVAALLDYGFLRLRPDLLTWSVSVADADPEDRSPVASQVWAVAAYAAWMAGDVAAMAERSARALEIAERQGVAIPPVVLSICGDVDLFEGRLDAAVTWYRRAIAAARAADDTGHRFLAAGTELLALSYADDAGAATLADELLAEVADEATPFAAYLWYCAGEADLEVDVNRARHRLARAVDLAETTNTAFVIGLAGASKASIEARIGDPVVAAADYRRLIEHWRRAGMWSTQWTMLRSIAGLLDRLGRPRDAAVLEGAVRATASGHRIFGADEVALDELGARLRRQLGPAQYQAARAEGALLDGDAAAEHALRCL